MQAKTAAVVVPGDSDGVAEAEALATGVAETEALAGAVGLTEGPALPGGHGWSF